MQAKMKSGGSSASAGLSEKQKQLLKERYGLDKPLLVAYSKWFSDALKGDFGRSFRYNEPVLETIVSRFPVSIFYGLMTMLITWSVCIPLGIVKALKHNTPIDSSTSVVIFLGYAIPNYVVAVILVLIFVAKYRMFPIGGFTSFEYDTLSTFEKIKDILYHAVLPLASYVAGTFALQTMLMKNSLMDNLAADYVRTALAKGNSFKKAVFKHAIRNSMIPIMTSIGGSILFIISGSFVIEQIFNINGFGLLGFQSLVNRDYPVVMGIISLSSLLSLIGNVISDFCVALTDPRVKFE